MWYELPPTSGCRRRAHFCPEQSRLEVAGTKPCRGGRWRVAEVRSADLDIPPPRAIASESGEVDDCGVARTRRSS